MALTCGLIGVHERVAAPPGTGGAPAAPTNVLLTQQGGTSNSTSPVSNSQKHTWTGSAGATGYRVYRGANGATPTLLQDVGNVLTYTDTTCTNSNDSNYQAFLDSYAYEFTAYNGSGESAHVKPRTFFMLNGTSNCGNGDFSFGIPPASENWAGTMSGRPCFIFNFVGGGAQPVSQSPLAGEWDLCVSPGYTNFIIDVCPGPTVVDNLLTFGRASRIPNAAGGDAFGWFAGVNIYNGSATYGPNPIANTWATYTIPLVTLGIGAGTFSGSIVNGVLHATALGTCPDIIAAGGRISGPGVPANTIVQAQGQNSSIGTFTLFGPGISGTTNVGATTMNYQCWNMYKLGFARSGNNTPWSIGFDNFGCS